MDITSLPQETFNNWLPPIIDNLTPFTNDSIVFAMSRLSGTQLSIDLSNEIKTLLANDAYIDISVLSTINELPDKDLGVAILPLEYAKKIYTTIVATDLNCLEYLTQIPTASKIYYYAYDFAECLAILRQNPMVFQGIKIVVRTKEQYSLLHRIVPNQEIYLITNWRELLNDQN